MNGKQLLACLGALLVWPIAQSPMVFLTGLTAGPVPLVLVLTLSGAAMVGCLISYATGPMLRARAADRERVAARRALGLPDHPVSA